MKDFSDIDLEFIESVADLIRFKEWFENKVDNIDFNNFRSYVLGLDTETTGLDIHSKDFKIRMVQIGDADTGWAIPWELWGGIAREYILKWVELGAKFTLHNANYDWSVFFLNSDIRIPWSSIFDTLIMAKVMRPGQPNDLKTLTSKFVDPVAALGDKELKKEFKRGGWGWDTIPINNPVYVTYSCLDPILAYRLLMYFAFDEGVFAQIPQDLDLEMAVREISTRYMEIPGFRIDMDYCKKNFDSLGEQVEIEKQKFKEDYGYSLASPQQVVELFTSLGAEFTRFSATTGNPSADKKQLEEFMESDNKVVAEAAERIMSTKKKDKVRSSYFKNFINMAVYDDEGQPWIHANVNPLGADRTGRQSVTNPALQTLHSSDSLVRSAFLPNNDDEVLISCDYSQVELRLLAHFSEDENLIHAFKNADDTGGDFFVEIGKKVYHDENFQKEDKRRKLIKGVMYGLSYGASTKVMAGTAGVSISEMQEVVDDIFSTYPGIQGYQKRVINLGDKRFREEGRPYIKLSTGRKLYAEVFGNDPASYKLQNYLLQGTASLVMKNALVRVVNAGYGEMLKLCVHDELIMSVPKPQVKHVIEDVSNIMAVTDGSFSVDLLSEGEILGDRWGHGYVDDPEIQHRYDYLLED